MVLEVVQRNATVGLDCSSKARRVGRSGRTCVLRPEVVAADAVPDVELVADDGKEHWVAAVQQLAVLDGLKTHLGQDTRCTTPIPADPMTCFRLKEGGHVHVRVMVALWASGRRETQPP